MDKEVFNIKMEVPDLSVDIPRFDTVDSLGIINSSDILTQFMEEDGEDEENDEHDDILVFYMDLREPLSSLGTIVENRVGMQMKDYEFWLQDTQMLESHKNLVDQCVQGEGLVQINVQIQTNKTRINIVDVLKPTDEVLANYQSDSTNVKSPTTKEVDNDVVHINKNLTTINTNSLETPPNIETANKTIMKQVFVKNGENTKVDSIKDNVIRWIVDTNFKKDQERLKIPDDPSQWTMSHVKHWLQWAVRQFNLVNIKLQDWCISGKVLCTMSLREFQVKVPHDPDDVFWTHIQLLRKCKFVAIIQKKITETDYDALIEGQAILGKLNKVSKISNSGNDSISYPRNNNTGNNGQIQLWQFLLEILTDREHRDIIHWIGKDGEFKLSNPELVAQLWGERKNKPTMNYEKLSRALRYYYDGDMISKVTGKRFVYKFVCDLKDLIGYNAEQLAELVENDNLDQQTQQHFL